MAALASSSNTTPAAAPASQNETADLPQKIFLRSKVDPKFQIEVGPSVIKCCSILTNVTEHTDNSDAVEVDMSQKQLQKFVELHNHFPENASITDKDTEWTNAFFKEMSDDEFKEICWKADYLDSERFLEAAGQFILAKLEDSDVKEIQSYLNIVDDYTEEERRGLDQHPLEFFTGLSIQEVEPAAAANRQGASGDA